MNRLKINQQLKQFNIEIPQNLERDVKNQLEELSNKKQRKFSIKLRTLAVVFSLVLILFMGIYTTPITATVSDIFENLIINGRGGSGSFGIDDALEKGYPSTSVILKDGDYYLIVDELIIDESKVDFLAKLESDEFSEDKHYFILWKPAIEKGRTSIFGYGLLDQEGPCRIMLDSQNEGTISVDEILSLEGGLPLSFDIYEFNAEITLDNQQDLDKLMEYISENDPDTRLSFKVPFYEENIKYAKEYTLNDVLEFKEGTITLDKLEVYPTEAKLYTTSIPHEGYDMLALDYFTIVDTVTGEKMRVEYGGGEENVNKDVYTLTPSLYFDLDDAKLQFDGFKYQYSLEDEPFELSLSDLPYTIDYEGANVTITDLNKEGNELTLIANVETEDKFRLYEFFINNDKKPLYRGSLLEHETIDGFWLLPTKIENTFLTEDTEPYLLELGNENILRPHDVLIDLDLEKIK